MYVIFNNLLMDIGDFVFLDTEENLRRGSGHNAVCDKHT